jgi:ABC-2 type transport system permease protein
MKTFIWLLRREFWEARAIWIAPAICALIVIGGTLIAAFGAGNVQVNGIEFEQFKSGMDAQKLSGIVSLALGVLAMPFFVTVLFTQFFYTTDALYSERRDRSILFWKSLPISDTSAVLSKLAIAGLVMPAVGALAAVISEVAVFIIASAKLSVLPGLAVHLWEPGVWATWLMVLAYLLLANMLWYLPLLGWLLLVSAWAPRAPFMYAILPPLAIALAEYVVFRTHWVMSVVAERIGNMGFLAHAMGSHAGAGFGVVIDAKTVTMPSSIASLMQPMAYLTSPAVWLGVCFAIGTVAAAIWVRRYRDSTI